MIEGFISHSSGEVQTKDLGENRLNQLKIGTGKSSSRVRKPWAAWWRILRTHLRTQRSLRTQFSWIHHEPSPISAVHWGLLGILPPFVFFGGQICGSFSESIKWRFPKLGDPQVTIGSNTKMVIHDLDDLGTPVFQESPKCITWWRTTHESV